MKTIDKKWFKDPCIEKAAELDDLYILKGCNKYNTVSWDADHHYLLLEYFLEQGAEKCAQFQFKKLNDLSVKGIFLFAKLANDNANESLFDYLHNTYSKSMAENVIFALIIAGRNGLAIRLTEKVGRTKAFTFTGLGQALYKFNKKDKYDHNNYDTFPLLPLNSGQVNTILADYINADDNNFKLKAYKKHLTVLGWHNAENISRFISAVSECQLPPEQENVLIEMIKREYGPIMNYKSRLGGGELPHINITDYIIKIHSYCLGDTSIEDAYRDLMEF